MHNIKTLTIFHFYSLKSLKSVVVVFVLFYSLFIVAQTNSNKHKEDLKINTIINGTLLKANDFNTERIAILISDYGPVDRNGNQDFQKNFNLKKIAIELSKNNIASFRYDKRTSKRLKQSELNTITFNDFVMDAKAVVTYFKNRSKYKRIYIIGHGQGSLVGMLASEDTNGFIALAGTGENIGDVILNQINNTARQHIEQTKRTISSLKLGKTTTDFPKELATMFNIDVQPFMISWMAHTPKDIIKNLKIPLLIINGTKDLEVSEEEASALAKANSNAKFILIKDMNHVLYTIKGDNLENSKSYNQAYRPINAKLLESVINFIKNN